MIQTLLMWLVSLHCNIFLLTTLPVENCLTNGPQGLCGVCDRLQYTSNNYKRLTIAYNTYTRITRGLQSLTIHIQELCPLTIVYNRAARIARYLQALVIHPRN